MVWFGQSCRVVSFDSASSRCFVHSRLCPDERLVSARYPGVGGDLLLAAIGMHPPCWAPLLVPTIAGQGFQQDPWRNPTRAVFPHGSQDPKDLQTPADVRPGSMFPLALSAPKTLGLRYLLGSYLGITQGPWVPRPCHICIVTSGW